MRTSTKVTISGRLPGLNDYSRVCRSGAKAGATMKRKTERAISWAITESQAEAVHGKVKVSFLWVEPDRRRDLDNVAFAKKFILDALVRRGIIDGDGQAHVVGFADSFAVDPAEPRVEVVVEGVEQCEKL